MVRSWVEGTERGDWTWRPEVKGRAGQSGRPTWYSAKARLIGGNPLSAGQTLPLCDTARADGRPEVVTHSVPTAAILDYTDAVGESVERGPHMMEMGSLVRT